MSSGMNKHVSLGPHMDVFFGHTPLTEKNGHTVFYGFFSTTCRNMLGFIRVIYANGRKIMAIRANTAKYGSLTEKKNSHTGCQVQYSDRFSFKKEDIRHVLKSNCRLDCAQAEPARCRSTCRFHGSNLCPKALANLGTSL